MVDQADFLLPDNLDVQLFKDLRIFYDGPSKNAAGGMVRIAPVARYPETEKSPGDGILLPTPDILCPF